MKESTNSFGRHKFSPVILPLFWSPNHCRLQYGVESAMTGSSHVIDYFVITAADLTAILIAWLAGKGWLEKKAEQISKVNWQRSGSLYWLSSDLVWTEMQVVAGRVPRIMHGLQKAIHHATSLGVSDPLLSRLKALEVANAARQNLTEADKTALITELDDIIGQIGKLAELHQGDFKADPERRG